MEIDKRSGEKELEENNSENQSVEQLSKDDGKELNKELEDHIKKIEEAFETRMLEQKDHYMRLLAEQDNRRKRAEHDAKIAAEYSVERLVSELLNVLYCVEKASKDEKIDEEARKGLEITAKNMLSGLKKNGILLLTPEIGEDFDTNKHQALSTEESEEHGEGKILKTIQPGFTLNGRLVSPALVVVGA